VVVGAGAHALVDANVTYPEVLGTDCAGATAFSAIHARRLRRRRVALVRLDDFDFVHQIVASFSRAL
jgi:hypothetical protein